jgi:hypothetical protein
MKSKTTQTGITFRRFSLHRLLVRRLRLASSAVGLAVTLTAAEELVSIDFRNRIPGVLDAPVYNTDGITPLAGPDHYAQLYFSPATPDALTPIGHPFQAFGTGTNAGYWDPAVITLPPEYRVTLGQEVYYQVRVGTVGYWGIDDPFPKFLPVAFGKTYRMVVTNAVMPLVGLESFRLVMPERLRIRIQGDQMVLEWEDKGAPQYKLEATASLEPPVWWQTIWSRSTPGRAGDIIAVTNTLGTNRMFYQLWRGR